MSLEDSTNVERFERKCQSRSDGNDNESNDSNDKKSAMGV